MRQLEVHVHQVLDEDLRTKWQELWESSPSGHFYNSPAWFLTCLETFELTDYLIFVCREGDQIVGVCPLIRSSKYGIPVLKHPGNYYFDRSGLLVRDNDREILRALLQRILQVGDLYLLEVDQNLAETISGLGISHICRSCSFSPYIPLEKDPLRFVSSSNRNKVLNRLRRDGNFEVKVYSSALEMHLETVYRIEAQSRKARKAKRVFITEEARGFLRSVIKHHPGQVWISLLHHHGQAIAYDIGLIAKDTFTGIQKAFLSGYEYFNPGKALPFLYFPKIRELNGIGTIDLSRGKDACKRDFTPLVAEHFDFFFSRNPVKNVWYRWVKVVKQFVEAHPDLYEFLRISKIRLLGSG